MKPCGCKQDALCTQAKVCPNISILMCDDVYVKINRGKLLCRFSLNTAFIGPSNKLKFTKKDMDPDSVKLDKSFPDDFEVIVCFWTKQRISLQLDVLFRHVREMHEPNCSTGLLPQLHGCRQKGIF